MKVAIIGSRNITEIDENVIISHLPAGCDEIISGGARGIDSIAEEIAARLKLRFTRFEPEYSKYGKRAPVVRNRQIVERADYVLAVWDFLSRGTANTIAQCIERHKPVRIIDGRETSEKYIK